MPHETTTRCPHELRPGIKVCLHCLHDARVAAAARRLLAFKRFGIASVVLAAIAGVSGTGLQFLRGGEPDAATTPVVAAGRAAAGIPDSGGTGILSASVPEQAAAPVDSVVPSPAPLPPAPLSPVIPEGTSELPGGFSATRNGDTVVVSFDTQMLRTRRPAKFEEILRGSLALVYGASADSIVKAIPAGELVKETDLFAELPVRGLHVALPAGGTLSLWPQTRMREDGPLVVAYRATVAR